MIQYEFVQENVYGSDTSTPIDRIFSRRALIVTAPGTEEMGWPSKLAFVPVFPTGVLSERQPQAHFSRGSWLHSRAGKND